MGYGRFFDREQPHLHSALRWHVVIGPLAANQESVFPHPVEQAILPHINAVLFQFQSTRPRGARLPLLGPRKIERSNARFCESQNQLHRNSPKNF